MVPWINRMKELLKGVRPMVEVLLRVLALVRLAVWALGELLKLVRFWV